MARVLVADDERDAAETLAALLRVEGFETKVVFDGQSAVYAAVEFQPDILILDLMMPKLNGFQVAERLRELPVFKEKLFIALSALSQQQHLDRASKAQFDEYLVKPCKFRLLMQVLREMH